MMVDLIGVVNVAVGERITATPGEVREHYETRYVSDEYESYTWHNVEQHSPTSTHNTYCTHY